MKVCLSACKQMHMQSQNKYIAQCHAAWSKAVYAPKRW